MIMTLSRFSPWLLLFLLTPAGLVMAESDDEKTLIEFKTILWPQAYRNQDIELLDQLLHDSFQMIDGEGNRSDKARELEWISLNAWNPGTFEYRIERLDIYHGDTAIIDGMGIAEKYTYRSSNVLIMEKGEWKAIASHVSGYKERPQESQ